MLQSTSPIFFFLSVYTMFKSYLSIPSSKIFLRLLAITTKQWSSMNEHFMRWREFWWMHLRLRQKNLVSKILLEEEPEEEKNTCFHVIQSLHTMTEVLQKGQKRYSLCFNIKHNFFWHFCAYIYVRKHVSSELFDYLIIDWFLFSKW